VNNAIDEHLPVLAEKLAQQIELRKLGGCVHMLGRHSPETIVNLFSAADALLVTLKREPAFALTVPGKIQSYLACGKPIIASHEEIKANPRARSAKLRVAIKT